MHGSIVVGHLTSKEAKFMIHISEASSKARTSVYDPSRARGRLCCESFQAVILVWCPSVLISLISPFWLDPWTWTVSFSYKTLMLSACHITLWNFQCLFIKTDLFLVMYLFNFEKLLWQKTHTLNIIHSLLSLLPQL